MNCQVENEFPEECCLSPSSQPLKVLIKEEIVLPDETIKEEYDIDDVEEKESIKEEVNDDFSQFYVSPFIIKKDESDYCALEPMKPEPILKQNGDGTIEKLKENFIPHGIKKLHVTCQSCDEASVEDAEIAPEGSVLLLPKDRSIQTRHSRNNRKEDLTYSQTQREVQLMQSSKKSDSKIGKKNINLKKVHREGKNNVQCDECQATICRSRFMKHFLTHLKPFKCTECSKNFSSRQALKDHELKHKGQRNFQCEKCSKSFYTKSHLDDHTLSHTKPFKCTQCELRFSRPAYLRQHGLKHTGQKDFQCDVCKKQFYLKWHLLIHMGCHFKRYKCFNCHKLFSTRDHLTKHQKKEMGQKDYQCHYCSKCFHRKDILNSHVATHLKPFKCAVCKLAFATQGYLKVHEMKHI